MSITGSTTFAILLKGLRSPPKKLLILVNIPPVNPLSVSITGSMIAVILLIKPLFVF